MPAPSIGITDAGIKPVRRGLVPSLKLVPRVCPPACVQLQGAVHVHPYRIVFVEIPVPAAIKHADAGLLVNVPRKAASAHLAVQIPEAQAKDGVRHDPPVRPDGVTAPIVVKAVPYSLGGVVEEIPHALHPAYGAVPRKLCPGVP